MIDVLKKEFNYFFFFNFLWDKFIELKKDKYF